MPKRLRWLKQVPHAIREEATKELSLAYAAAFRRRADGSARVFDHIRFRSLKDRRPSSITIQSQNFSTGQGHRCDFYTTLLPGGGRLRFNNRDRRRIVDTNPEGPPRAVKMTMTRTGRFFLQVPLYVPKKQVRPEAIGRLVPLDPGSKPFLTYYSPTAMVTGSFGTSTDLETTVYPYQQRVDRISHLLSNSQNGPYLTPRTRKRLTLRRLRINEKVR
ncbi:hypothetical protein HK104_004347 [Borealophlyctis nickersoniae]|nr:hypothetical protein HK104_004347 [Borealophlyctis nickersoniae]